MKKMFAPLAPLKKVRISKRVLLVTGYILLVAVLIVAVAWRSQLPKLPGNTTPDVVNETIVPPVVNEPVITEPVAPPTLDGGVVVPGEQPIEVTTPALTVPKVPMSWPLAGTVLAGHHQVYRIGNTLRAHVGVDLKATKGMDVKASWPGVVERVTQDASLGWILEIRHGGNYLTTYGNLLEEPYVSVGDSVKQGAVVGKVGESAKLDATEGAYLHFAVYRDGTALDPVQVISAN